MYQNHTKDTKNNCNKSLLCDHKVSFVFYGFHLFPHSELLTLDLFVLMMGVFIWKFFYFTDKQSVAKSLQDIKSAIFLFCIHVFLQSSVSCVCYRKSLFRL